MFEIIDKVAKKTGKKIEAYRKNKIQHIIVDNSRDSITKLKELAELKKDGTITEQEFHLLKNEILPDTTPKQSLEYFDLSDLL